MKDQVREHELEQVGLAALKSYCDKYNIPYYDGHNDFSTGWDVKMGRLRLDLKVTNSDYLTLVRYYTKRGVWYSPIMEHIDIPYLILRNAGNRWTGYLVSKRDIYNEFMAQNSCKSKAQLGVYTSDGNIHITCDISRLLVTPWITHTVC